MVTVMKGRSGRRTLASGLEAALELHEFAVEVMRRDLRRGNPRAGAAQIDRQLAQWLLRRPGAADGDGVGVRGAWLRGRL